MKRAADAAAMLPVKVLLIINPAPPYWQDSRLHVDGHNVSRTHCRELLTEHTHTLKYPTVLECDAKRGPLEVIII